MASEIYKKNLIFTFFVFVLGFSIPYIQGITILQVLATILGLMLYLWSGYILIQVIKEVSKKQTSIQELKFLYITLALTCAAMYFYYGVMDSKEETIYGIRAIKDFQSYQIYTFKGAFEYFKDLFDTYLNSIYYSVVVMGTLGDSVISVKGGLGRLIVGFEVATALSITVFKIGEHYSELSSREVKASEQKILEAVDRLKPCSGRHKSSRILSRICRFFRL